MAHTGNAKTLADDIYHRIRADILSGRLTVGQRLKLAGMATDYGVSLNIVREALSRLASEKLVRTQPQLGFSVTAMSAAELKDLTMVRIATETLALRRSIELGGVEWEARLLAAHHRLANSPIPSPDQPGLRNEAYVEAHSSFHSALIAGCDSPLLLELCQSFHDSSELYRRMAYARRRVHKDPGREHKKMVDAAIARNVDLATDLLTKHYEATTRVCLDAGLCLPELLQSAA